MARVCESPLKMQTSKTQSGLSPTSPEMFCRRCVIIANADYLDCGDKIDMHKPVSQDGTVARLLHLAVLPKREEKVKLGVCVTEHRTSL